MSATIRAAIAEAEEMAHEREEMARRELADIDRRGISRLAAIGIASAVVEHRREATRWREIAAVLRESATE